MTEVWEAECDVGSQNHQEGLSAGQVHRKKSQRLYLLLSAARSPCDDCRHYRKRENTYSQTADYKLN